MVYLSLMKTVKLGQKYKFVPKRIFILQNKHHYTVPKTFINIEYTIINAISMHIITDDYNTSSSWWVSIHNTLVSIQISSKVNHT